MSTIIDDLYRYNRWANAKVFRLSEGLTDTQLDERRELGFGSLRNTLFHILAAEEIWLERWLNLPPRPFPVDAEGLPLTEIALRMELVDQRRRELIDRRRTDHWQVAVDYRDLRGNPHRNPLQDLLLHVANHGIHHRAQALSYLKSFGRTTPGGIDYLFFRLAWAQHQQDQATATQMRAYGLELESGTGDKVDWDQVIIHNYFAYGDWANARLLAAAKALNDESLNRSFGMGCDTIRRTVLHIQDAERWWLKNWTVGPTPFEKGSESLHPQAVMDAWGGIIQSRNQFLEGVDEHSAQRIVTALVGNMSVRMQVLESLIQLCGHGTHHRAQLLNMLRHSGCQLEGIDYLVWIRESQPPA